MLEQIARHALVDLTIRAEGDLHIDMHHTTEDTGIALGQAVREALGDKRGITRYADVHLPMDETLTRVALDFSGRPFLVFRTCFDRPKIGEFDTELVREFFQAFAMNALSDTCTSRLFTATTTTTSRNPASRGWPAPCARPWRSIERQADRVPSTKGSLAG